MGDEVKVLLEDGYLLELIGKGKPPPPKDEKFDKSPKYGFNMHFLKGLVRLAAFNKWIDLLFVGSLVALICVNLYVGSLTGGVTGKFYQLIVDKKLDAFKELLWKASLIVIGSSILETLIKLNLDIIGYKWRKKLVNGFHKRYFRNEMFYKLINLDHSVDNPDQRITQDVDLVCKSLVLVLRVFFEAPLTIFYYGYMSITTISWYSPLLVLGYWILAYSLNKLLMNPSVSAIFRQEQLEGNFRFGHVRIRTHSESISLYGGQYNEKNLAEISFESLMKNRLRLIKWETCVTATTNVFAYLSSIINYAIVAMPIFNEWKLPPSAGSAAEYVSVASFRLLMLINGFTQLNNASRDSTDFIGYSNRLSHMLEVMDRIDKKFGDSDNLRENQRPQHAYYQSTDLSNQSIGYKQNSSIFENETIQNEYLDISAMNRPSTIAFLNFTAYTPSGQTLVQKLNLSIPYGTSLLITGPSGSGKSSLLRCLAGLWDSFDGRIISHSSTLFLPQKPYLPYGTLRDQILYPSNDMDAFKKPSQDIESSDSSLDSDGLWQILKDVELEYLIYRSNAVSGPSKTTRESIRDLVDDLEDDEISDSHGYEQEKQHLLSKKNANLSRASSVTSMIRSVLDQIESSNQNWTEVLSPGEQQRLGLARVLYHKPLFAILDEATSCVDEALEAKFYKLCAERGISVITVGHRTGLKQFHQKTLTLDRRGRWELRSNL